MNNVETQTEEFGHAGFFILRSPLLPFSNLLDWNSGPESSARPSSNNEGSSSHVAWEVNVRMLRERLRAFIALPEVTNALAIASPSLWSGLKYWNKDPQSKRGRQVEKSLIKYFSRMCARPTPFGVFSGCSLGIVSALPGDFSLRLPSREAYRITTRIDFDYLFKLCAAISKDPIVHDSLKYAANTSLYRLSASWRYIESRFIDDHRSHHLVEIERNPVLDLIINDSVSGLTIADLVNQVTKRDSKHRIDPAALRRYIYDLIDNDVLASTLSPPITTNSALDDIINQIKCLPESDSIARKLETVRAVLQKADDKGILSTTDDYAPAVEILRSLEPDINMQKLFQVDLSKPANNIRIPQEVADEVIRCVSLLSKANPREEQSDVALFKAAFIARYDRAFVPLLEAIDHELGVGFGLVAIDRSSLLMGLQAELYPVESKKQVFKPIHELLLRRLKDSPSVAKEIIDLSFEDLSALTSEHAVLLPNSLSATVTIVAESNASLAEGKWTLRSKNSLRAKRCQIDGKILLRLT